MSLLLSYESAEDTSPVIHFDDLPKFNAGERATNSTLTYLPKAVTRCNALLSEHRVFALPECFYK